MATKITRDIIESYLNCKYKGHLKLGGESGTRSDYEAMSAAVTQASREQAIAELVARFGGGDACRGIAVSAATLARGAPLLVEASIEDEDLSLCFDGLKGVEGPSRVGGHHYLPVLHNHGDKVGRHPRVLLAVFGLTLARVQGLRPTTGLIVRGSEGRLGRVRLDAKLYRQAELILAELGRLQAGDEAPRLRLNAHCQFCEFRQRCQTEATTKDDLSLLRAMAEKEIKKCEKRGVFTVTQLSFTFRARRGRSVGQQKRVHQHALQALAIREKKVHVLGTPELPTSTTRIYFDIEGDPDRGFDYLLGLVVVADGVEHRHSFWADSRADEPRILRQFLDLVGRHLDAWLYTYGGYEAVFLRRVGKAAGLEEEVKRVLARSFNVLSVIHQHIYFPVYSNGLKDIGSYLGFAWSESNASGVQSVVWRRRWEETGSAELKEKLTTYNIEDCAALRKVTEFLYATCAGHPEAGVAMSHQDHEMTRVEEATTGGRMHGWNESIYGVADFEYVNDRASFDYLKDRICVRSGKPFKVDPTRKRAKKWRKNRRVNREVEMSSPSCPSCGGIELDRRQNRSLARLAFDLRLTRTGIRSCVTRYRTAWHHCTGCGKRFLPPDYLRLEEFCHSLKSWAMYEHVAHRTSLPSIAETIRDCFNLPIYNRQIHSFKQLLARYYEGTYQRLLERIVAGHIVHADETEVHVRRVGKAYVWVFTNLEEVVFMYRPSREGNFLHEVLKGFRGVLVSDFYAGYDSLKCEQQKCLIHLLRDFNQDILANPWDEELKSVAGGFGGLLRAVVATVDVYGLKKRHLGKHKRDIDRFFEGIAETTYRSEAAESYRQRLLKCRCKLFTFIEHDGVPWHNNAAEHAVKAFAHYRKVADSMISEAGLAPYLVLLSIQQTCKYKAVSFLKFLLSRQTDIDVFRESRGKITVPAIELYPEGSESDRPSRKRLEM
jgi:predicted RecB family nuclease